VVAVLLALPALLDLVLLVLVLVLALVVLALAALVQQRLLRLVLVQQPALVLKNLAVSVLAQHRHRNQHLHHLVQVLRQLASVDLVRIRQLLSLHLLLVRQLLLLTLRVLVLDLVSGARIDILVYYCVAVYDGIFVSFSPTR
jgi:hypothetical protein